jgi:hypothetical protein
VFRSFDLKRDRDRRIQKRPYKNHRQRDSLSLRPILEHFGEDAFGRDGHGHASKSKETLYAIGLLLKLSYF